MSLTSVGIPVGAILETESAVMEATTACPHGGIMCVDKITRTTSTPPRFYKMTPTGAVPSASVGAVRTAWYGLCIEPGGIAAGKQGRFLFVGEAAFALIANAVPTIDAPLYACHSFTNTTATSNLHAHMWATAVTGTGTATIMFGQKCIGMPTVSQTSAASSYQGVQFNGIHGFGIHCGSVVA